MYNYSRELLRTVIWTGGFPGNRCQKITQIICSDSLSKLKFRWLFKWASVLTHSAKFFTHQVIIVYFLSIIIIIIIYSLQLRSRCFVFFRTLTVIQDLVVWNPINPRYFSLLVWKEKFGNFFLDKCPCSKTGVPVFEQHLLVWKGL